MNDDEESSTSSLGDFSLAHPESSLTLYRKQLILLKWHIVMLGTTADTRFHSSVTSLTGYAARSCRLFCLHGKESWFRTPVIRAIASSGEYLVTLHEARVDAWKFLDVFSSLDCPSDSCFIMDNIAFTKSLIERNSVRFRILRQEYSPRESPSRSR